jgi:hypothetical protein
LLQDKGLCAAGQANNAFRSSLICTIFRALGVPKPGTAECEGCVGSQPFLPKEREVVLLLLRSFVKLRNNFTF